ncbi:MAG TPA: hypothetical protein VF521_13310 [Pyrinomonadaceae bacterium]
MKELFKLIVGAHGSITQLTTEYFQVLEEDLSDWPAEQIREALRLHRTRSKFAPAPTELLELLRDLAGRVERPADVPQIGALSDQDVADMADALAFMFRHQFAGDRKALGEYIEAMSWLPPRQRQRIKDATAKLIRERKAETA